MKMDWVLLMYVFLSQMEFTVLWTNGKS
jgi:hypothetical protein